MLLRRKRKEMARILIFYTLDINDNFCYSSKTRKTKTAPSGVNKHVSRKYKKENEHISTFYLEHVMLMDSEQMNLISFFNFSILLIWRFDDFSIFCICHESWILWRFVRGRWRRVNRKPSVLPLKAWSFYKIQIFQNQVFF